MDAREHIEEAERLIDNSKAMLFGGNELDGAIIAMAQAHATLAIGKLLMQGETVLPDGTLFRLGKAQPAFEEPQ